MPRPDQLAHVIEKHLGRVASDALTSASGIDTDPLLLDWVQRLGAQVASHSDRTELPPQFVLSGSDTANALTLPGSLVFVTRGLLDEVTSEDELVGVLAHEAAHVAKRHAWKQLTSNAIFLTALSLVKTRSRELRLGGLLVNLLRALAQSRANELEADAVGLGFAVAAGYHPEGMNRFLERLARGPLADWEEYFTTHPSGPKRVEKNRQSRLLSATDPDSRASIAAGFDARSLPHLAQLVRRGGDPFAFPALPARPVPPALQPERTEIRERSHKQLERLMATYRPLNVGATLQQLLLLTATTADLRFVALATHAYLLQLKVQDVYARSVRLLRTAPGVWDALLPDPFVTPLESAQGRNEILECLLEVDGTPDPLRRAAEAAALALTDLNVGRFYRLSGSAQWTRIGAIEGLILYAERELVRADRASSLAWHRLSKARVRRYRTTLNRLVPPTDPAKVATWQALAERRFGRPLERGEPAGEATLRVALATRGVAGTAGIPENVATALRLLTLELERELAAATT